MQLTLGSFITARRKELFLTPSQLISSCVKLSRLNAQLFNEIERDRVDLRQIDQNGDIFEGLSETLGVERAQLEALSESYEEARELQVEMLRRLEVEAVAFRARTEKG